MNHVSENVSLQHYCLNLNLATLFWTPRRAQAQSLRPARGAARFRTRCAPKAGLWPGAGRGAARFRTCAPPKLALWPGARCSAHFRTPPRAQSWHLALGIAAGRAGATLVPPRLNCWLVRVVRLVGPKDDHLVCFEAGAVI